MHQNEYKQAHVWSSGSWDSLCIFHIKQDILSKIIKQVVSIVSIKKDYQLGTKGLNLPIFSIFLKRFKIREVNKIGFIPTTTDIFLSNFMHGWILSRFWFGLNPCERADYT